MKRSTYLATAFVMVALLLLTVPFLPGRTGHVDDLLLNLAPEVIGIVVTLAIVERMLERQRAEDESRRVAWRALHQLDHAVWVWQGGARQFEFGELMGLLALASDADPIPPFTQNLLLVLGSTAEATLRINPEAVGASSHLERALKDLGKLSSIRDRNDILRPTQVSLVLQEAAVGLAEAIGLAPRGGVIDDTLAQARNPSVEAQRWRHYGDRPVRESAV